MTRSSTMFNRTAAMLVLSAVAFPLSAQDDVQHVVPDRMAHQWGDTPFNTQGVAQLLGLIVAVITIIAFFENRFRKAADAVDVRLKALETAETVHRVKMEDFVPKGEIDRRFEHASMNLRHVEKATMDAFGRQVDATTALRVEISRMDERLVGANGDVGELKAQMKEMLAKIDFIRDRLAK